MKEKCTQIEKSGCNQISCIYLFLLSPYTLLKAHRKKDPDPTTCLSHFKMKTQEQSEGSLEV